VKQQKYRLSSRRKDREQSGDSGFSRPSPGFTPTAASAAAAGGTGSLAVELLKSRFGSQYGRHQLPAELNHAGRNGRTFSSVARFFIAKFHYTGPTGQKNGPVGPV